MTRTTRTSTYSAGILLTAGYSVFWLGLLLLAALATAAGLTFGLADAAPHEVTELWWIGGIAGAVVSGLAALNAVVLMLCWGAWRGSRRCAYGLIAVSLFRFIGPDLIAFPIGLITFIGAIQSLDSTRSASPA